MQAVCACAFVTVEQSWLCDILSFSPEKRNSAIFL